MYIVFLLSSAHTPGARIPHFIQQRYGLYHFRSSHSSPTSALCTLYAFR